LCATELPQPLYAARMDPAFAALLGASIGGAASIMAGTVGPWVKDSVDRNSAFKTTLKRETRQEVVGVISSFGSLLRARQTNQDGASILALHTDCAVSITRLSVLLRKNESDIEAMLGMVLNTISSMRPVLEAYALTAMQDVLHRWSRGELKGSGIGDEYERQLRDLPTRPSET
jgi:hypothetical protein